MRKIIMKKLALFGFFAISLSACTTTTPSQPTPKHEVYNPHCEREYPKPKVTADNFGSPEMVEWTNRMLECQKRSN